MSNTFWMVYGLHQRSPTVRHKTERSAVEEASRLARINPGVQFFVLEATHNIVKRDVDVTPLGRAALYDTPDFSRPDYDDGIPF